MIGHEITGSLHQSDALLVSEHNDTAEFLIGLNVGPIVQRHTPDAGGIVPQKPYFRVDTYKNSSSQQAKAASTVSTGYRISSFFKPTKTFSS